MKWILLVCLSFLLWGCPGNVADMRQSRIQRIPGKSTESLREIKDVASVYAEALKPETVDDFFELVGVVNLELTDVSVLGDIQSVVLLDHRWFVLDRQNMIFRFEFDGRFSGLIGSIGQGPGEYQDAYRLYAWNDLLAVYDAMRGLVVVYDQEGNFVRNLDTRRMAVYIHDSLFFEENRWYVGSFGSRSAEVPANAILDVSPETGKISLVGGFGQRFPWAYQPHILRNIPGASLEGFAMVEGRIWSGSPYYSGIEVYDRDGHFIARLPSGMDGIQPEDYQGITDHQEVTQLRHEKKFNGKITYLAPYVFVQFIQLGRNNGRIAVYDAEGNLIRSHLNYGKRPLLDKQTTGEGYLISPIDTYYEPEWFKKALSASEWQLVLESGFDPESFTEGNPMLLLSRLRRDLLPEASESF